ncbi:MAG: hypothetical protein L0387_10295 [Acidobacteria bacterium]|nr:hypothetical protein [Acidobacteriota bacterium]MCI0717990.1 hypothetical protein [Acidobacteriota bacterium]
MNTDRHGWKCSVVPPRFSVPWGHILKFKIETYRRVSAFISSSVFIGVHLWLGTHPWFKRI